MTVRANDVKIGREANGKARRRVASIHELPLRGLLGNPAAGVKNFRMPDSTNVATV
jgi:hypothetical protein